MQWSASDAHREALWACGFTVFNVGTNIEGYEMTGCSAITRAGKWFAALVLACGPAAALALPPNDECASPTPISGVGNWNLDDLLTATLSIAPPPIPSSTKDVWFCWTPSWSGLATLDIGATSLLLADVYLGCPCPAVGTPPLLSLAAATGVASGSFQVTCDQRYLIRIAAELYPFPVPGPVRAFSLAKTTGDDCPPPADGDCDDCCGGKPAYDDPLWTASYTGQVAVMTQSTVGRFGPPGGNPSVNVVEWVNFAQAPPPVAGAVWNPVPAGAAPTTFRYFKPNWNFGTLGSIFAVAIDNNGDVFTAYCAATNGPTGSSLTGSTSGSIFRIDAVTGTPTVFCNIPDNTTPPPVLPNCYPGTYGGSVADCMIPSTCPPGIGDVAVDCANGSQVFASCFADGRIYRISAAGVPIDTFDHASNTIQSAAAVVGNLYDRYAPRGSRVWAVQPHQGRLYYSVWGQEGPCDNVSILPGSMPNTIWSVGLSGAGTFVPNSRRMEMQVPAFPPMTTQGQFLNFQISHPVSDISFSAQCRMMLAERNISEMGVLVGAHAVRGLEYAWNGTAWISTFPRLFGAPTQGPLGHPIGFNIFPTLPPSTNSCGGVDYDNSTGALPLGRVWLTADQMTASGGSFGMEGIDQAAPNLSTNIGIPFGVGGNKAQMCDVEIPCVGQPNPCFNVSRDKILCPDATTPCFTYTFDLTNKSGFSVKYVTVPLHPSPGSPITINPNVINLLQQDGSLLDDGETTTITLTICNAQPGDEFCLRIGLVTPDFVECCFKEICLTMPECDCGQLRDQEISKVSCVDGLVTFTYSFTLENLSDFPADWVIFIPFKDETATFLKDFFFLPPLLPGGTFPMSVQIVGAEPGETFCFHVLLQNPEGEVDGCCCAFEKCITVPPCPTTPLCPGDCDRNGAVDIDDVLRVISAWGPCVPRCDSDFAPPPAGDGVVDINDLLLVIGAWGPCP